MVNAAAAAAAATASAAARSEGCGSTAGFLAPLFRRCLLLLLGAIALSTAAATASVCTSAPSDTAAAAVCSLLHLVRSFLLGVLEPRFVDFLVDQLLCRLHNRHTPAADRRDVHLPHVVLAVAVVVVLDDDFGAAFLSA